MQSTISNLSRAHVQASRRGLLGKLGAMAAIILGLTTTSYGVDLELGNLFFKTQSSTIDHASDGLAVRGDITMLHPLNPKTSLYLRTLVAYNQGDSFIPFGIDLGVRFYGERLTKRVQPYLATSLNYNRSKSNACKPTEDTTLNCEKNIVNLRLGGGFKAKFNAKLYMFLETNFANSPLYGLITYPDGAETTYFGLKVTSYVLDPTRSLLFGAGLQL